MIAPQTPEMIGQRMVRYEYANGHPRTPCTDGGWQAGAYVQCEGPRLYEARWRRLIGTTEARYVPDRGLLCEPHARAFCERYGLHMPGEEPEKAKAPVRAENEGLGSPESHATEASSVPPLAQAAGSGTALCAACHPAWGSFAAGTAHVPAPGGCPHACHQALPA